MRYGDLKKQVAEMVIAKLEPLQAEYRRITADPGYLAAILREGKERVEPLANATVDLVKQRMGLYSAERQSRSLPKVELLEKTVRKIVLDGG
jgi:tryptophanyl-tRNA synthetase